MSIVTFLEVEQDVLFPVDNPWGSKALDGFVTSAWHYCDCVQKGLPRAALEDWQREVVDWFGPVAAAMKNNLCVLARAWYGSWPYRADEFDRYLVEYIPLDTAKTPPTLEQFMDVCHEVEEKWTDIRALRRTINALVDALEQVCPPETWWYVDPDSLEDFAELSDVLSAALEAGYSRVRLTSQ